MSLWSSSTTAAFDASRTAKSKAFRLRNQVALATLATGLALFSAIAEAQHRPKERHPERFSVCDMTSAYSQVGRTIAVKGRAEQSIEWAGLIDERCPNTIVYLRYHTGGPTLMSCLTDDKPAKSCGGYRVNTQVVTAIGVLLKIKRFRFASNGHSLLTTAAFLELNALRTKGWSQHKRPDSAIAPRAPGARASDRDGSP